MRYAIIENGGKQYKVYEGKTIDIDHMQAEPGTEIDLENVLLVSDGDKIRVGTPNINRANVSATVIEQVKGPKIVVFKYRPRNRYRVKTGHRQKYTRVQINKISLSAKTKTKKDDQDGS
ncbi:MAG: 50S ribosomal protein L21 [Anaerolineales bacterium]|jgi:large subunit ribosomal protein L21